MTSMRALLPFVLMLLPLPAGAWSGFGHWMVGELAGQQLNFRARAEVQRLLAGEADPTLAGVASWADALRYRDPARFQATSAWHYINARGGGCNFDVARDCPNGNCVVVAIQRQWDVLANPTQPLEARREALKFLVHLVGDIHQPLHAGSQADSGGNRFQVSLATDLEPETYSRGAVQGGVVGTNLHAVWDHYVLASARLAREVHAIGLRRAMPRNESAPVRSAPLHWARESCALSEVRGVYPAQHAIDDRYLNAQRPVAERRIAQAAARLAALLNAALTPR
jgi:hypothetical protein